MGEFKFILSKEKFAEIDETVDDTVYSATKLSDEEYLVRWEAKDGWGRCRIHC